MGKRKNLMNLFKKIVIIVLIDSEISDTLEEQDDEWESNEDNHYEEEEENVAEEKNKEEEDVEIEYKNIDLNLFEWWNNHKVEFPIIVQLAQKYLIIPATSVPSERLFSDAGNHITSKEEAWSQKDSLLRRNKQLINIHPPDGY
ncbi:zinc finger BED domain-containing protein 1-like [Rhizophagus clarus]|uniref:Zinc finger BED domain-containing protein 1-like n=1 Tax=Rhizophagus clarus TaxID=94130 RepID=A0A8H3R3R1_9GLOM|nr:zinc finger BED domain-containing protein 1-like [Rhizophagus clarus]